MPGRPSDPLLAFLRDTIRHRQLSTAIVAARTGIERAALKRKLGGQEPLTVDEFILLSQVLEVTPEQAVVREAHEELGVEVKVIRLAAEVWLNGKQQFFFLVEQTGGTFGTGAGEEFASDRDPARGTYEPMWMPLAQVTAQNVLPKQVAELVAKSHPENWPAAPIVIREM